MSRKPSLSAAEMRARVRHLEQHNAQLTVELRGCRDAMRQQQRHIRQLLRTLEQWTPKRTAGAA